MVSGISYWITEFCKYLSGVCLVHFCLSKLTAINLLEYLESVVKVCALARPSLSQCANVLSKVQSVHNDQNRNRVSPEWSRTLAKLFKRDNISLV